MMEPLEGLFMIRILSLLVLFTTPAFSEEYPTHPRFHLTPGLARDLTVTKYAERSGGKMLVLLRPR
jgi:hypothetical protein